jgi:hypothetical protein
MFYEIALPDSALEHLPTGLEWYTADQAGKLPKPVLITNYLRNQFG